MINKQVHSLSESVSDIHDGSTIMISGFGEAGSPIELIHALIDHGARNLTIISNNTASGHVGLAALIEMKRVQKMICNELVDKVDYIFYPHLPRLKLDI